MSSNSEDSVSVFLLCSESTSERDFFFELRFERGWLYDSQSKVVVLAFSNYWMRLLEVVVKTDILYFCNYCNYYKNL